MLRNLVLFFVFFPLFFACTVRYTYVKPDYEQNERLRLKRIAFQVEPTMASDERRLVEQLFALMSVEFVGHHKEYIVRRPVFEGENLEPEAYCAQDEQLNGVVINRISELERDGSDMELAVQATLYDCSNGQRVWEAQAENSFDTNDPDLQTLISSYSNRVDAEVRDFVAPFYLIVRKLFDSLPDPLLNDDDIDEKIEADSL